MKAIILSAVLLLCFSSCNSDCNDALCACPSIDLEFSYPDPSSIGVSVIALQTNTEISDNTFSISKTDNAIRVSLSARLAVDQPSNYLVLFVNSLTSEIDSVTNFKFDSFSCEKDLCGDQGCVTIDEQLTFDVNGENYSILDLPIAP